MRGELTFLNACVRMTFYNILTDITKNNPASYYYNPYYTDEGDKLQ